MSSVIHVLMNKSEKIKNAQSLILNPMKPKYKLSMNEWYLQTLYF